MHAAVADSGGDLPLQASERMAASVLSTSSGVFQSPGVTRAEDGV
jgi:hypothetical protein